MNRISLIAVATASLLSLAVPAMASPFGDGSKDQRDFRASNILISLQQKGVNATSVEEWGSLVRAFVVGGDGHVVMEYFQPDSLTQVSL
jgi:hypothetical protein